ncbi:hypothetical protein [Rhodococcus tibetensis]|uniref:MFS transporter n=1 Tax=Rhodococcus tibetensis TaxID=2965064 RepID=A0ABT1QGA2_9NOCA|nr:hypothetical protein [Rhodococcus sp. FXJ9.536]MCQ4120703.1 hypothetical protein [Rhodococcus sp. FXJ9.536]
MGVPHEHGTPVCGLLPRGEGSARRLSTLNCNRGRHNQKGRCCAAGSVADGALSAIRGGPSARHANAAGAGNELSAVVPGVAGQQIEAAAQSVFSNAFISVMIVCALVCGVGSLIAYALVRTKDLHESATIDVE